MIAPQPSLTGGVAHGTFVPCGHRCRIEPEWPVIRRLHAAQLAAGRDAEHKGTFDMVRSTDASGAQDIAAYCAGQVAISS